MSDNLYIPKAAALDLGNLAKADEEQPLPLLSLLELQALVMALVGVLPQALVPLVSDTAAVIQNELERGNTPEEDQ